MIAIENMWCEVAVVKGSFIKMKWSNNDKIQLFLAECEYGDQKITFNDIEDDCWYLLEDDKAEFYLTKVKLISNDEQYNEYEE